MSLTEKKSEQNSIAFQPIRAMTSTPSNFLNRFLNYHKFYTSEAVNELQCNSMINRIKFSMSFIRKSKIRQNSQLSKLSKINKLYETKSNQEQKWPLENSIGLIMDDLFESNTDFCQKALQVIKPTLFQWLFFNKTLINFELNK